MPRAGKVKLAYIERGNMRRSTFRRRSQCLMKKVEEISVKTGEMGCGIIFSPEGEPPLFWPPSPSGVMEVIQRFEHLCSIGKCTEVATQDSCVRDMNVKLEKQRMKELEEIREREINYLMCSIFQHGWSIENTLSYGQAYEILRYMEELNWKYLVKMYELTGDEQSTPPVPPPRVSEKFKLFMTGGTSQSGTSTANMKNETNGGFGVAPPPPVLPNNTLEIKGGMGLAPPN